MLSVVVGTRVIPIVGKEIEAQQSKKHPPGSVQISGPPEIQKWTCTAPKSIPLISSRKGAGGIKSAREMFFRCARTDQVWEGAGRASETREAKL